MTELWLTICSIIAIIFWFIGYLLGRADQEQIYKEKIKHILERTRYIVEGFKHGN